MMEFPVLQQDMAVIQGVEDSVQMFNVPLWTAQQHLTFLKEIVVQFVRQAMSVQQLLNRQMKFLRKNLNLDCQTVPVSRVGLGKLELLEDQEPQVRLVVLDHQDHNRIFSHF